MAGDDDNDDGDDVDDDDDDDDDEPVMVDMTVMMWYKNCFRQSKIFSLVNY